MERYNVYKKQGAIIEPGNFIKIANHIMHRSFIDNMVLPDSTYSYYVTTVNQTSESDPSEKVEITMNAGNQNLAVITGTLYDDQNNEPIANGKVRFTEANTCHGPVAYTNEQGEFIVHLEPGDYYMRSMAMEYLPEFYDNVPIIQLATLITVNIGDSLNFDIGLAPFTPPVLYTLSGNVTDTLGNPLRARIMVTPVRMNSYYQHHHQHCPLRGSHLVLPFHRLPITRAVSFLHPHDGRPVMAIPWEGAILFGTTDVDHKANIQTDPSIAHPKRNI